MIIDKNKCILCKACQLICEKGTIHFKNKDDGVEITIRNRLCEEECRKCLDICPVDAIQVGAKSIDHQEKVFVRYYYCDNCNRPIMQYDGSDKNLCEKCKKALAAQKLLQCNGLI